MSQENQSPNPRESTTVRQSEPGFPFHEQSGDQRLTPSARGSIPETPGASHRPYRSRPTSSNASASSPPKLSRRKSSFIPSEESDDSDEYSDDSKNSKKRVKRKGLKKRLSYRRKSEDIIDNNNEEDTGNDDGNNDQNDSESDREFTIKDRQEVINTMHPFGMPIWKSALYKKSRSVIRDANSALHSTPTTELYLYPGNILWAILFGWELALVSFIVSLFLSITPCGGERYALVLRELSYYIFWPFGKYVEKIDEWSEENDEHSVIPLSYFIGMAVASISAQSSAGLGAVVNATFGSIIEIILYSIALTLGEGKLAEGSIIGSLLCGVLLLPGFSMISGGLKRKEQKFNAKSAGVTSTMLIMAIIGALTPTLFYQTFAPYRMTCKNVTCVDIQASYCQVCQHIQVDPIETPLYRQYVKPLMYFCSTILVLSYAIGLWFTLNTHAALVWQSSHQTPEPEQSIYRRLVPLHILQQLLPHHSTQDSPVGTTHSARPTSAPDSNTDINHNSPLNDRNIHLDTIAAAVSFAENQQLRPTTYESDEEIVGHDSPNWGKTKSVVVLLTCTILYTLIAEMLISNVEVLSASSDKKLLGLTLFAIVPTFTEFVNAMGFAINGNIALSMEIGSAYALQVCLLQIPAMVLFSEIYNRDRKIENQ
ncbi:23337_t:CDS:2, partial [Racocetra persica]